MERRLKSILISVGVIGAIVLILNLAQSITQTESPSQHASPPPVAAYNPQKICDDAWTSVIDHKNENPPYFDVKLRPGCWSGFLYLPKTWHTWYDEPVGDANGWWVSVWYSGWSQGRGPYGPGNIPAFNGVPSVLRLQGNGTIRYYTNQAPDQPIAEAAAPKLDVQRTEPIGTAQPNFIYEPDKLCYDSTEQELHYEQNEIDHFTVTMREGCWSPLIYVPNSWQSSYYAESLGKEPDWWVAIWLQRTGAPKRKRPHGAEMFERRGPFTRDDSNSSPYWKGWYGPVFRLQGKGEIYLSQTPLR